MRSHRRNVKKIIQHHPRGNARIQLSRMGRKMGKIHGYQHEQALGFGNRQGRCTRLLWPRRRSMAAGFQFRIEELGISLHHCMQAACKRHEMGLGSLHTVSLAQARALARECRSLLLEGKDPLEARNAVKTVNALSQVRLKTFDRCAQRTLMRTAAAGRTPSMQASGKIRWPPTQPRSSVRCLSLRWIPIWSSRCWPRYGAPRRRLRRDCAAGSKASWTGPR